MTMIYGFVVVSGSDGCCLELRFGLGVDHESLISSHEITKICPQFVFLINRYVWVWAQYFYRRIMSYA